MAFSKLTKRLSKKVNFRYFTPQELREIGPEDTDTPEDEKRNPKHRVKAQGYSRRNADMDEKLGRSKSAKQVPAY